MKRIGICLIILCCLSSIFSFLLWVDHYQDTLIVLVDSEDPIDIVFDGFDKTDVNKAKDDLLEKGYGKGLHHFIYDQTLTNPYTLGMIISFIISIMTLIVFFSYYRHREKKREDEVLNALKDGQVIEDNVILETMETIRNNYQSKLKDMALDHDSQNQELENLAHQMKSTLSTILLHVDQISDKENVHHKELIINQIDRCNETLNRFLKGYDVRSNLTNYHYEIKNVADCIQTAIQHVNTMTTHKKLSIESHLVNCTMALDSFWIQEAIETVLMNAIESADPNSTIYVIMEKHSNELQISIINEGDCPKYIHAMFTRYNSSRQNQEHYGIGLHMVQTVCKNHMGNILASYQNNKMSIQIILPLHQLESIQY